MREYSKPDRLETFRRKVIDELSGVNLALAAIFVVLGLVLAAIVPSQSLGYVIAAIVALIVAFVAYPWQKSKDRDLKVDEEKRKIIADLIRALEAHFSALTDASPVSIEKVPSFATEIMDLRTSFALAQAYGCGSVVSAISAYETSAKDYMRKLGREKSLRSTCPPRDGRSGQVNRTPEYTAAQDARSLAWSGLRNSRQKLFNILGEELGVNLVAQSVEEQPVNDLDEKK